MGKRTFEIIQVVDQFSWEISAPKQLDQLLSPRVDKGFSKKEYERVERIRAMKLNLNLSKLEQKIQRKLFNRYCYQEIVEELTSTMNIPVWYLEDYTSSISGEVSHNFALELSKDLFLGISFNHRSQSFVVYDVFYNLRGAPVIISQIESINLAKDGEVHQTKDFLNLLLDALKKNGVKTEITSEQLYRAWENFLSIEELILDIARDENFSLKIIEIVSNIPESFHVEVSGNMDNLSSKMNSEFQLNNGGVLVTGFVIKARISRNIINIAHNSFEDLNKLTVGCYLTEDFKGRQVELSRKRKAFEALRKGESANIELKRLLVAPESISSPTKRESIHSWCNPDLSDESKEIIQEAFSSENIFLIQGPPGTGKTTMIAEMCNQAMAKGLRVLVAGQTNLSVDNVLEKIVEHAPERKKDIVRIGYEAKINLASALESLPKNQVKAFIRSIRSEIDIINNICLAESKFKLSSSEVEELKKLSLNKEYQKINEVTLKDENIRLETLRKDEEQLERKITESGDYNSLLVQIKRDQASLSLYCFCIDKGIKVFELRNTLKIDSYQKSLKVDITEVIRRISDISSVTQKVTREFQEDLPVFREMEKESNSFLSIFSKKPTQDYKYKIADIMDRYKRLPALQVVQSELILKKLSLEVQYNNLKNEPRLSEDKSNQVLRILHSIADNISALVGLQSIENSKLDIEVLKNILNSGVDKINTFINMHQNASIDLQNIKKEINVLTKAIQDLVCRIKSAQEHIDTSEVVLAELTTAFNLNILHQGEVSEDQLFKLTGRIEIKDSLTSYQVEYNKLLVNLAKDSPLDHELIQDYVLETAKVFITTCSQVAGRQFEKIKKEFDYVIIDEASKAFPTELFIPLIHGKKIILVGDHKQLLPFIDESVKKCLPEESIKWLNKSLFEDLYLKVPQENKAHLRVQYRMDDDIFQLVSTIFYDDELLQGKSTPLLYNAPFSQLNFINVENGEVFDGRNYSNEIEVKLILNKLSELSNLSVVRGLSIGLISMYRKQSERLYEEVEGRFPNLDIEIGTVDSFQGREKNIILISTVRTKENLGHISSPQRINVSISRARNAVFIFGNEKTLRKSDHFSKVLDFIQLRKKEAA